MGRNLELETLTTYIDGNDDGLQKILKHAEAATGISSKNIEGKLGEIEKALDDLGKADLKDLEKSMASLAEKTIAFRNELKVDEIHSYIDMLESVKKKQDSLSSFKDKTGSSSAGIETLFTGGNKSLSAFSNATTSKNPFSAFTKELPQAKSSLDAFNASLGQKSVSSMEAWTNATTKATSKFSAFNKETASNKSLSQFNQFFTKSTAEVSKWNGVIDKSVKLGQVFKVAVGFSMAQAAHKIAEELIKDVFMLNKFNDELERSNKLAQQSSYFKNRDQSRKEMERSFLSPDQQKNSLQKDLPGAEQKLRQAFLDRSRAAAELKTFGEGDKLFGTTHYKVAVKEMEEAEKAVADAKEEVDNLKDSVTRLNHELTQKKIGDTLGKGLNQIGYFADIAIKKLEEIKKKSDDIIERDAKIAERMGMAGAGKNQSLRQQIERDSLRDQLKRSPLKFNDIEINDQVRKLEEAQKLENRMDKQEFFKGLKEDAEGFAAELKGIPRDIIEMENELKRMKETGLFSDDELSEARGLMKKKIQMQRQLADRRAGDPNRLGIQGVEARGAEAFAKLRGQFNSDKTPLDSIATNIEKQLTVMEQIRDKDYFAEFTPAGLN